MVPTDAGTARMISLETSIQGSIGWHRLGNWAPSNQSKATFGPGWPLGPISWAPVALEQPSHVPLDAGV